MRTHRLHLSIAFFATTLVACVDPGARPGEEGDPTVDPTTDEGSTEESSTETTMPETSEGTGDMGFIPDTGGESGCGELCDIWANDCGDGEKCTAVACEVGSASWDTNICVDIGGDKLKGDACNGAGVDGLDDCGPGLMCWDGDPETGQGTCIEFCGGSPGSGTCSDPGELCAIVNDGVLPICLPECDPLAPACPNPDNVCLPNTENDGFICVLDASGDTGGYGDACEFANACDQGLLCLTASVVPGCDGSNLGCCSEMCELGAANNCSGAAGGQVCQAYYEEGMAPPGYDSVGVCAIPQ